MEKLHSIQKMAFSREDWHGWPIIELCNCSLFDGVYLIYKAAITDTHSAPSEPLVFFDIGVNGYGRRAMD